MANIMITESCNLRCSYCFANEFVNKQCNYISMEAFHKALDFIKSAKHFDGRVGIIGGEPTVAPNFREILEVLIHDDAVKSVALYTNGVLLDRYMPLLVSPKVDFLINLNSPDEIGQEVYQRILNNIQLLAENGKLSHVALGVNLYKKDQNVEYFISALKRFSIRYARLAVTTPNDIQMESGFQRLKSLRGELLKLTTRLLYEKINFVIDCNRPPECIWEEDESIKLGLIHKKLLNEKQQRNFFVSRCNPVIDILPDLTAIRCFGLSEVTKVKISDFENIDLLKEYYEKYFDREILKQPTAEQCRSCKQFQEQTCYGGCLSNKRCC